MIWYILTSLIFIIYLELSGQYILSKLGKNNYTFGFAFGLMSLMAYCYITTSILTSLNCHFILIVVIYSFYILASIILMLKDIKKIRYHFDLNNWIIAFIFVGVMLYYAWNTTLGDTSGYDTVFYLNMISTNAKIGQLNSTSVYWGGAGHDLTAQYTFQSYYYFLSYFIFFALRILNKITTVTNMSITVWIFQIIYNFFFVSLLINGLNKIAKGKVLFKYVILFIYLFFYGKLYFNNVFGFYGNTYRTIAISYSIMALYDLYNDNNKANWTIFSISLLSSCAFSSTAVFETIFIFFISFFTLVKKEKMFFKHYACILFIPIINLIAAGLEDYNLAICIVISFIICLMMFIFNDYLITFSNLKYTKLIIAGVVCLMMFTMSYRITNNIFDFSAFFESGSEIYDMNIDYFSLDVHFGQAQNAFRVMVWILLTYAFVFERKNSLILSFLVLVVVVLNPFCCSYLKRINDVYYRAFEIIINPFTIILFLKLFLNRLNNKFCEYGILVIILLAFAMNIDYLDPLYYHSTFEPSENYNNLMKMSNDEFDLLMYLRDDVNYYYNNVKTPYIITSNLFTESVIPNASYIYSRHYYAKERNYADKQLYSIFYPTDYNGEKYELVEPDYANLAIYLKEENVRYVVVDKNESYYDEELGYYNYLVYKVANCGYGYSVYSNDSYELFRFD